MIFEEFAERYHYLIKKNKIDDNPKFKELDDYDLMNIYTCIYIFSEHLNSSYKRDLEKYKKQSFYTIGQEDC